MPNDERKPYRLLRGHYSRREGDAVPMRDNETGKRVGGKSTPFVRYQAKTPENMNTRNELMLTDREAAALGYGTARSRVTPLGRHNVQTGGSEEAAHVKTLDELISLGMAVNGTKSLNDFRREVMESGYLIGVRSIPNKKLEILALLRNIQHARNVADAS